MERPNMGNMILNDVKEGMLVCDNTGDEIGKVRQVFLGAVSEQTDKRGGGPATASTPELQDETVIDYVAKAFAEEELPEVLRERLLRHGFIRIDSSGVFASDRYASSDQIEAVTDDCVKLRVMKDELIEH